MTTEAITGQPSPIVDMGELAPYAGGHRLISAELGSDQLVARWEDGAASRFHYIWLRDHCACHECRHPQTRERTFEVIDLPERLPMPQATVTEDGALRVFWPAMDDWAAHESLFDPGWLRLHAYDDSDPRPLPDPDRVTTWGRELAGALPTVAHAMFMTSDHGLRQWLGALTRYGFVLLDGGPAEPEEVIRVAERVGWPRETNFGRHFDVVSRPNPNNAAFTAIRLEPHVDLPNWQRPPDFQLLYCLENDAEGGASLFTDGFAVAEALRAEDPEAFALLTSLPVDFRFQDERADIRFRAPVIGLDEHGRLAEIRFNNWIRDALRLPADRTAVFYRAYQHFWRLLRDPRFTVHFSLRPGQMIAFDNLRVLHGREAFDPSTGRRHLQGTYLDRDLVLSALRVLERSAG